MPCGPDGVVELAARQRAEVAQQHDGRQAEQRHRADQRAADQLAPGEAGLVDALLEGVDDVGLLLRRGVRRVPVLGDLLVDHQLLGPLDRAGADQEQRQPEAQAQGHVVRVAGQRAEDELGVARDGEVRDAGSRARAGRPG